jgi:hypothetical protein
MASGSSSAVASFFPVKADFQAVDETVLEYLLYRGFTRSFRTVAADCQSDRTRAFDAETVVKEVFDLIQQHDLQGFHALWCCFLFCSLAPRPPKLHRPGGGGGGGRS